MKHFAMAVCVYLFLVLARNGKSPTMAWAGLGMAMITTVAIIRK